MSTNEPTSTEPTSTRTRSGSAELRRRTLVGAGAVAAWSLPAVQIAVATPAAAASGPRFDLQMQNFSGDDAFWYNDDRTQFLKYGSLASPTVHNAGPDAAPAGTVLVVVSDNRVLGAPTLSVRSAQGVAADSIVISGPVVDGDRSTFRAVFGAPLPSGATVSFSAPAGDYLTDADVAAIHDLEAAFPGLTAQTFTVTAGSGQDTDASNDSLTGGASIGTVVPWNGSIAAEWSEMTVGSCTYPYASAVVVTSNGVNPIPVDTQVYYYFDARYISALSVASVTIDGAPASLREGSISFEGQYGSAVLFTTAPIAPGSVLRIEFSSTENPSAVPQVSPTTASGGLGQDESESDTGDNYFSREGVCV